MTNPILEIMNRYIHAHAGRGQRAPATPVEPPEVTVSKEDHPCNGCPMRDQKTNVPYCFLPVCLRDDKRLNINAPPRVE